MEQSKASWLSEMDRPEFAPECINCWLGDFEQLTLCFKP